MRTILVGPIRVGHQFAPELSALRLGSISYPNFEDFCLGANRSKKWKVAAKNGK
jgi:hypothetical protein